MMNNLHSHRAGWGVLIVLCVLTASGCAQPVATIDDMASFDLSQDQNAIAGYYRSEAMVLKEKAAWHAESAARYAHLFGSESDWVSGAKQLSQYYTEAAQELEYQAEAHAEVARTGRQKLQLPPKACCNK